MRISASIVIYKTPDEVLREVLRSITAENIPCDLVVVDNSPQPVMPRVLAEFRQVRYFAAGENLGYGRGHNFAISKVDGADYPYHLVVNPDVYWQGSVLKPLMSYLEAHEDVALVMPQVVHPDGQLQYLCKLLPTPADLLTRRMLPPWIGRFRRAEYELRFTGYCRDMNVPYLSGCFMFLRRAAFDAIGGFDGRFFMYPEDIDLTRRLHQRWRTMFHPTVCIVHGHAKASYKSLRMLAIHLWNMAKYFNKWGWFWDPERKRTNKTTLATLRGELAVKTAR